MQSLVSVLSRKRKKQLMDLLSLQSGQCRSGLVSIKNKFEINPPPVS